MNINVIATNTLLIVFTISTLFGCGGGGSSSDGSTNTINAALTYTVAEPGNTTRRLVTDLAGSERLQFEEPDGSPGLRPQLSPDKQYLAYVKDNRLYLASTKRNTVRELSRFQHEAGSVRAFTWSPDSRYLAYIGDADTESDFNAYVVSIDGNSHTQVNPDVAGDFVSNELHFSPASDWITYRANQDNPGGTIFEGYVSRIDGTDNRRFTGTISSGIVLARFTWSPDGRYIAYSVEDPAAGSFNDGVNTHDTIVGGRNSIRISHDFSVHNIYVRVDKFEWSPNSNLLAYSLKVNRTGLDGGSSIRRLFTAVPGISGSSAETINGPMDINTEVGEWLWSPNGDYVAYEVVTLTNVASGVIRQDAGINTYDVVQSGNGDSNSRRITETTGGPLGQGFKTVEGMIWTPDSEYILYLALIEKSNTKELYRSQPDVSEHSTLLSLETGISNQDDVGSFRLAPDGEQVAYSQRSEGANSAYEIYLTDVLNTLADTQLSSEPVMDGQLSPPAIRWSRQSTHIAFISDATTPAKAELYVAANDGAGSDRVSGNIADEADVVSVEFID